MDAITYGTLRANLASTLDRVCDDHEALVITRNGEQSVVMLSLEDYKHLEEAADLLRIVGPIMLGNLQADATVGVVASDYSQPQPAEEREWVDAPTVGGELI